ncbi:MTMR2, partial [Symbiodinium sp. CCMP2456]
MDPLTALRKQTEAKQAERAEVVPVATAVPLPAGYASAPAAVAVATTVTAPEKAAPSASAVPAAPAEAVPPPALASFLAPAATVATSSSPGSGASPPRPTFEGTLAGEHVVEQVKSCSLLVQNPFCEVAGRLQMTPYRLKFMIPKGSLRKELQWMREAKYFDVPFGAVESAKEETSTSTAGQTVYKLTITTKDLRVLCFFMPTDAEMRLVSEAVAAFGCPGNPAMLFATKHFEALKKEGALEVPDSGWCFYDPIQDSARMGIDTELIPNPQCPWRVSELNRHYRLCSSYPSVLVLPRRMPDQALREVAAFRKRGRLPALSWCGGPELGFASLWRCSQTTEGLMGQKCIEDQAMLNAIRLGAGSKDRDLLLIDLRPRMNAWVNKAGGGGFEAYPNCRVIFGGIENIHAVRDAWRAMGAAVRNIVEGQVGSWFKDVANSGWYDYIGAILGSTLKVVEEILNNQANVVIHCSDGWDRTAQ